ncbi:hypothetical protein WCT79_00185 [Pectobacterium carotovorum]|uniref:hypothetical protein n=1 Tax=Pectobacterium carotovorum TaxID=554 RepID=UPI0030186FDF
MFTVKNASIIVNSIYGKKNKSLDFEYMYSFLTRKTSYLTREFIRADGVDKSKIKETYIESLSWLIAISQYLETDLESSFFSKFPGICPYCIKSPCRCSQTHRKPEFTSNARKIKEELAYSKDAIYRNGKTQIYAPDMINDIYPSNKNIFNIFGGFYHSSRLFEELGELHEAYAKLKEDKFYSKTNLDDELADILAWMLSLWGIMFKDTDLGDAIDNYYIKGCPSCNSSECICDDYSGRMVSTSSRNEALGKIKSLIRKEVENTSSNEEDVILKLESSILSIDDAISSGSESDARRTVAEVDSALAFIYQTTPTLSPTPNQTELLCELDKSRKLI